MVEKQIEAPFSVWFLPNAVAKSIKMANRLALSSSPYLQQHAHNPVDWFAWGDEALQKAKQENKPIFLSIGYSSCHWCHVMEKEAFSDRGIAKILNAEFVPIKVDREERPDLDHIYMSAVQMMTGSGGWPLNVFLTPDLRPFFGGTYFPVEAKFGRPPFKEVLIRLADVFKTESAMVRQNADQLTALLVQQGQYFQGRRELEPRLYEAVIKNIAASVEPTYGGLGQAPKFFHVDGLRLLLREAQATSSSDLTAKLELSLKSMAAGGVYDQVGGGFHRYSTDNEWRVPHFEKMLYDNALLAVLYLEAFEALKNPFYARIARETLDWVLREMQNSKGGFYSAIDADSADVQGEKHEGEFYIWTQDELASALGTDAESFQKNYHARLGGNFERGRSVLYLDHQSDLEAVALDSQAAREKLLARRALRKWPLIDRKVQTSWNGLMISALVMGARILDEKKYVEAATAAADRLVPAARKTNSGAIKQLVHSFMDAEEGERLNDVSFLEDYAYFGDALIDLYHFTGRADYLERAEELGAILLKRFYDSEQGGFWTTGPEVFDLLVRSKEIHDGAMPSPYAIALSFLFRLWNLKQNTDVLDAVYKSTLAILGNAMETPGGFHRFVLFYETYRKDPCADGKCAIA